jgi:hypothetical protein
MTGQFTLTLRGPQRPGIVHDAGEPRVLVMVSKLGR